jgi:hypothetical protein
MGQITDLVFITFGSSESSFLLLIDSVGQMADLFLLFRNDTVQPSCLFLECGCEIFELLIFQEGLLHTFVLDFFKFVSVETVHVFEFTIFCLDFLIKPSLPVQLCLLQFFPQFLYFFFAAFLQFLVCLVSIFQSFVESVLNQF